MKRTVCLALASILLCTVIGCTDKDNNAADPDAVTSAVMDIEPVITEESTTVTEEITAVTDEPADTLGLSTNTEDFVNGECSVTLIYPRYGDGEHELFDISMRNYVMQKYNQSGMMPEDNAAYEVTACDIKYESEYFVSAVITGHIINTTAAHDSYFAYTVNADPRTGRVYLSEELVGELDLIKNGIADGSFVQSYRGDNILDEILDEITAEDITRGWRQDYGVFPDMYFTKDNFGVIAEVAKVLGGYAGFEIPYTEVGDMINPAAKGLCGLIVTTD